MSYSLPHIIENKYGEKIHFRHMEGNRLILEAWCRPKAGPAMHVHFHQDESITVVNGTIGYQIQGEEPKFGGPGTTLVFQRGVAHRFWNAGDDELYIHGWIDPAENVVFFLSNLYDAFNRGSDNRPEVFDGAYLTYRFRNEYDVPDMPAFVKKVVIPVTYFIGWTLGKYSKFESAPQPLHWSSLVSLL